MVEGDELRLLGAFAGNQALLHILLVEAVQSARRGQMLRGKRKEGGKGAEGRCEVTFTNSQPIKSLCTYGAFAALASWA